MTTTAHQTVLSPEELTCLRECAEGRTIARDGRVLDALAAKGMLDAHGGRYLLTPAARHVLHPGEPGTLPGIDN